MSKIGGFFLVVFTFIAGFLIGKKAQCSTEIEPLDDIDEAGENNKVGCGNKINNVINWSFNVNKG